VITQSLRRWALPTTHRALQDSENARRRRSQAFTPPRAAMDHNPSLFAP
jgi:hypothetical protein